MKTLMTHLYYGDISPAFSQKLALTLYAAGADYLEIGIPYSDPVCDGAIFQNSCRKALQQGITPYAVLAGIKKIRQMTNKPIYLTTYFGPMFKIGVERFLQKAKECGVSGLIIPDLPLEEQKSYRKYFEKIKLPLVQFATVYSDKERLSQIIAASRDFIYVMSIPGITGDNYQIRKDLKKLILAIKSKTKIKTLVGFGIRTPDEAAEITKLGADGIIIGSRIAESYNQVCPPDLTVRLSSSIRTRLTERSKEDLRISNTLRQSANRKEILKKIRELVIKVKKAIS